MIKYKSIATSQGQDILSAYGEAVAEAGRDEKLRQGLSGRERELLPGFSEHYRRLKALPRRMRRAMQREWKRTLAGVALMMALGAGPSVAATINVDTNDPRVNILDGKCSLIEAIMNANDNLLGLLSGDLSCEPGSSTLNPSPNGADTIVLPANTTHTIPFCNINFRGCTGTPVIRTQITINGNGSTIRRDPTNPNDFRIFAVSRGGFDMGNLTLQNTTVSGGRIISYDNHGGGVYNYRGFLTITNSTISGNSTSAVRSRGGGVYNKGGTLTITNSTISGNSTSFSFRGSRGGGVYNDYGTMTVTNSTISGNSTSGEASDGGGVVNDHGNLTITNSTISGNSTLGPFANGGGVYNFNGNLTITNSTISGNSTKGNSSDGGGMVNRGGTLSVTNSTISGNSTKGNDSYGGGVFNSDRVGVYNSKGNLTITNSTISGNSTSGPESKGGGVFNDGTLTITNSTLSGNRTFGGPYSHGGGVFNDGTLTVTNSTITRNIGAGGTKSSLVGGVLNYGALTLTRTIISGNFHADGSLYLSEVASFPSITTNGFNLFGHKALTTFGQALYGVTPGATDITATSNGKKPTLITSILNITLANNGGPTRTHALVTGSPAIDAVTTGCPPPVTDQRGFSRPGGARCDIGAFEK